MGVEVEAPCLAKVMEQKKSLSLTVDVSNTLIMNGFFWFAMIVHLLHNKLTACYRPPSTVAERGASSKIIFTVFFHPFLDKTDKTGLMLKIRINLRANSGLSPQVVEAVKRSPEKALSVSLLGNEDGYWKHRVSDNRDLINSVDFKSGSTYTMNLREPVSYYDVDVNSLSAGSMYLLIIDINKELPGSHRSIIKFRLVWFLFDMQSNWWVHSQQVHLLIWFSIIDNHFIFSNETKDRCS